MKAREKTQQAHQNTGLKTRRFVMKSLEMENHFLVAKTAQKFHLLPNWFLFFGRARTTKSCGCSLVALFNLFFPITIDILVADP